MPGKGIVSDLTDLDALEAELSSLLGSDVWISFSDAEIEEKNLFEGERAALAQIRNPKGRKAWLKGRAALKNLLKRINRRPKDLSERAGDEFESESATCAAEVADLVDEDTSKLRVPHPVLSLSHCHDLAIAIAAMSANAKGAGVDIESRRPVKPEAVRFFLLPDEQEQARNQAAENAASNLSDSQQLLRLWTVKEALFKADLENSGKTVLNYRVLNISSESGKAVSLSAPFRSFRYASKNLDKYWITVALAGESNEL